MTSTQQSIRMTKSGTSPPPSLDAVSELIGGYTILTSQPQIDFSTKDSLRPPKCDRHMTTLEIIDIGLVADNDWCNDVKWSINDHWYMLLWLVPLEKSI